MTVLNLKHLDSISKIQNQAHKNHRSFQIRHFPSTKLEKIVKNLGLFRSDANNISAFFSHVFLNFHELIIVIILQLQRDAKRFH